MTRLIIIISNIFLLTYPFDVLQFYQTDVPARGGVGKNNHSTINNFKKGKEMTEAEKFCIALCDTNCITVNIIIGESMFSSKLTDYLIKRTGNIVTVEDVRSISTLSFIFDFDEYTIIERDEDEYNFTHKNGSEISVALF